MSSRRRRGRGDQAPGGPLAARRSTGSTPANRCDPACANGVWLRCPRPRPQTAGCHCSRNWIYRCRVRHSLEIATDFAAGPDRGWCSMKRHRCARLLVITGASVIALTGGVGVAHAQPQPPPPPVPSIIDQLVQQFPALWIDPNDEGGPTTLPWGGVGMFCENQWVHCR